MAIIGFKLDLAVVLIDATTGRSIYDSGAAFLRNGEAAWPMSKGEGNYVFLNTGRENFTLGVTLRGYEPYEYYIDYEKLEEGMPLFPVFLIPVTDIPSGESLVTLTGTLSGLTEIEAVCTWRPGFCIDSYNPKKGIMTFFSMLGAKSMEDVNYGLVNVDSGEYEPIEVVKNLENNSVKLKADIASEFKQNAPLCRIIYGYADGNGRYLLRMRDSADEIPVIIRYCVKGKWKYLQGEFHQISADGLGKKKESPGKEGE